MDALHNDPVKAAKEEYDIIIVGGGIYGICLNLEASRRGLKSLLIEKEDFGGAASLNSLRILHGGLRYLQSLDLPRFLESVQQRGWFMEQFPNLSRPLECVMPLYKKGLKRKSVFQVALGLNNLLSYKSKLPSSRLINALETKNKIQHLPQKGLEGAAVWYDGQILSPQRLHIELLRWAAALGAKALNYTAAKSLIIEKEQVIGVRCENNEFRSRNVINAAGGWAGDTATIFGEDNTGILTKSLAFNVLLNKPSISNSAVALQGESVYFVTPHQSGKAFVGTIHQLWDGQDNPSEQTITNFLEDLNRTVPGWNLQRSDILRITSGLVPSRGPNNASMAHRSIFKRHKVNGLYSICGNKYTTAQSFAGGTLTKIFGKIPLKPSKPNNTNRGSYVDPLKVANLDDSSLNDLIDQEAVTTTEDLLERRIDWIFDQNLRTDLKNRTARILNNKN